MKVIAVAIADSVEHAIELTNDTEYSLASALWTKDIHRGQEIARLIRAGMLVALLSPPSYSSFRAGNTQINGPTTNFEPTHSFGGVGGASGYGRYDVDEFTYKHTIAVHPPHLPYIFAKPA